MSAFHIDGRISLKMEYELAIRLGEYISKTNPADKQIAALGWRLARLADEDESSSEDRPEWTRTAIPAAQDESQENFAVSSREKFAVNSMRGKIASVKPEKIRWGY